MTYPDSVELCEVGPRDGFQFEEKPIPTEMKVEVMRDLARAGLRRIQATSFVHPSWVPQMADAEEVIAALAANDEVVITALALNMRGLERACAAGVTHVDLSIATNERHSRDNANMGAEEALAEGLRMVKWAQEKHMIPQIGFQTVFGYAAPGDTPTDRVTDMTRRFAALGVESISLADSTGMANPESIRQITGAVLDTAADVPIVLHLHDTRGLGMSNVVAALEMGVRRFDTSMGGMGGCPFIPGATGNIATEDTVYLMDSLGIRSGVALAEVAACTARMETFLRKSFPGKLHTLQRMTSRSAQADG